MLKKVPEKLKCIVVSLNNATERRSQIAETLNKHVGIEWEFFDALRADSQEVDLQVDEQDQVNHYGRPLTSNEIGCYKSHYAILRDHAKLDNWLLVLEDDVWFDPDFDLKEILNYAESKGLLYIRLFAKYYKPAKVISMLSNFRQVVLYKTDPYGAQAYLIHSQGARAFLSSQNRIVKPIDDELGRFWIHSLWPVAVFPFPAVERSVVSFIENERKQKNMDRIKWSPKLLAHRTAEKLRKIVATLHVPL